MKSDIGPVGMKNPIVLRNGYSTKLAPQSMGRNPVLKKMQMNIESVTYIISYDSVEHPMNAMIAITPILITTLRATILN